MADDENPNDDAEGKAARPKAKRSPMLLVALAVAGAAVLGGVGGAFLMKGGKADEERAADIDPARPQEAEGHGRPGGSAKGKDDDHGTAASAPARDAGTILELDQFIVNLADTPEIRYLKVSIMLELPVGRNAQVTDRMPQIRDSLLILLSSKTSDAIRTVEGKMELREEIVQRVNAVLGANVVTAAYFTDFVAQ
jgi:flagellar FliL protein